MFFPSLCQELLYFSFSSRIVLQVTMFFATVEPNTIFFKQTSLFVLLCDFFFFNLFVLALYINFAALCTIEGF